MKSCTVHIMPPITSFCTISLTLNYYLVIGFKCILTYSTFVLAYLLLCTFYEYFALKIDVKEIDKSF